MLKGFLYIVACAGLLGCGAPEDYNLELNGKADVCNDCFSLSVDDEGFKAKIGKDEYPVKIKGYEDKVTIEIVGVSKVTLNPDYEIVDTDIIDEKARAKLAAASSYAQTYVTKNIDSMVELVDETALLLEGLPKDDPAANERFWNSEDGRNFEILVGLTLMAAALPINAEAYLAYMAGEMVALNFALFNLSTWVTVGSGFIIGDGFGIFVYVLNKASSLFSRGVTLLNCTGSRCAAEALEPLFAVMQ